MFSDNSNWRRTNARNVSSQIALRSPTYIINCAVKPNIRLHSPPTQYRSCFETNPLKDLNNNKVCLVTRKPEQESKGFNNVHYIQGEVHSFFPYLGSVSPLLAHAWSKRQNSDRLLHKGPRFRWLTESRKYARKPRVIRASGCTRMKELKGFTAYIISL